MKSIITFIFVTFTIYVHAQNITGEANPIASKLVVNQYVCNPGSYNTQIVWSCSNAQVTPVSGNLTVNIIFPSAGTYTISCTLTYKYPDNSTATKNLVFTAIAKLPTILYNYDVMGCRTKRYISTLKSYKEDISDLENNNPINKSSNSVSDSTTNALSCQVYPNPTTGELVIRNNAYENATVSIFSIDGKRLLNKQLPKGDNHLDLSDFPIGNYPIIINNDKKVEHWIIEKQ